LLHGLPGLLNVPLPDRAGVESTLSLLLDEVFA
jgi:hypothetical protein